MEVVVAPSHKLVIAVVEKLDAQREVGVGGGATDSLQAKHYVESVLPRPK